MSIILGTAGHIDHGKTTLVRALTGIDCDRLAEEKRRGITIELGFAWMDLPGGNRLGIVDVPGHEHFVKNMVAGTAGIDFVMLVIAADEGVMPQTREHLEICSLLGVKQGFVALTKADLVEQDWLEFVCDDVRNFLKGSFLADAPILPVSTVSGQGLDAVRQHVCQCAMQIPPRKGGGIFRLPVDRVFSMKGHGTVVTGTVVSGRVEDKAELCCLPAGTACRVRSLQRHGQEVGQVEGGQRCAINIQGMEVREIERGFVLAKPDELLPARKWLVQLQCLASSPTPLRQNTELHFHHGTRECLARVHLFDRDRLAPSESALAEMRFREDMVGVAGDHCVLRSCSPLRTVAGGMLLHPCPPELRRKDRLYQERMQCLARLHELHGQGLAKADASAHSTLVDAILRLHASNGASEGHLRVFTGLSGKSVEEALAMLGSQGQALCIDKKIRHWISRSALEDLQSACLARMAELHEREPLKGSFAATAILAEWCRDLPPFLPQKVIEQLCKTGKLEQEGDGLRMTGHKIVLAADQAGLRQKLLDAHRQGGLTPPNAKDVLEELGIAPKDANPMLAMLCREGLLVKIRDGLYYDAAALEEILQKVRQWFEKNDNLDVVALREILGLSRKYLIALLEYMDNAQLTVRVGDQRRWRGH